MHDNKKSIFTKKQKASELSSTLKIKAPLSELSLLEKS